MKKLLAVVLTLCMLVAIVPIVAHADGDGDIECTGALVLSDSIDIKIYVNGVSDPSGYSVKYDDGETTTEKALSEGTQVADGKYGFTVASFPANQMTREVTFQVLNGSEVVEELPFSIKAYVEAARETRSDDELLMDLCDALMTYGYYAQETFPATASDPITEDDCREGLGWVEDFEANLEAYTPSISVADPVKGASASLALESWTELNIFLKGTETADGVTVTLIDPETEEETEWTNIAVAKAGKDKCRVKIKGLRTLDMMSLVRLEYGDTEIWYSPMSYVKYQVEHESKFTNVSKAFYIYCNLARQYFSEPIVEDPMPEEIEDRYAELQCVAHGDLNLVFGFSGTICPETPSEKPVGERGLEIVLSEVFGYPATMTDAELSRVRSDYGGLGDGQFSGTHDVEVTFTNPELGTTYVASFDLAINKCVAGSYCGAIVDRGFLSVCPDEWPDDLAAARNVIDKNHNVGNPDFWNSNDVKLIDADEYTLEVVEAWFREVTGLTGDEWTFFIDDFDADQGIDGDAVHIGLRCDDVNGEGRTFIIACHAKLQLGQEEPEPEQPMVVTWVDEAPDFTAPISADAWGPVAQYIKDGYVNNVIHNYNATCENVTGEMYYAYDNDYVYIGMVSPDADVAGSDGWWDGEGLQMKIYKDDANDANAVNFAVTLAGDGATVEYGNTVGAGVEGNIVVADGNLNVMAKIPVADLGLTADDIAEGTELGITFIRISGTSDNGYAGWLAYGAFFGPNDEKNPGLTETGVITLGEKPEIEDPMPAAIADKLEELECIAHGKLDLTFGTGGTLEHINEVLTGIFGY
ncbi:MAG: hypothetical protein IKH09_09720, partial [Clostridia bacterium]|nr:hypothetical protein [Clostridia bacterium]